MLLVNNSQGIPTDQSMPYLNFVRKVTTTVVLLVDELKPTQYPDIKVGILKSICILSMLFTTTNYQLPPKSNSSTWYRSILVNGTNTVTLGTECIY